MTTIAYRGGVMAGDSCWSDGSCIVASQTKVIVLKSGALYGGAGDCDDRDLVAALERARSPEGLPPTSDLRAIESGCCALVVFPGRELWYIESGTLGQAYPIRKHYAAIGSGREHALTAMDLGADAQKAVEAACARDIYSRPPITFVELKSRKKR